MTEIAATLPRATARGADSGPQPVRRALSADDWLMRAGIALAGAWLLVTMALPLWALLSKSFADRDGGFVGLANYVRYFSSPALFASIGNSFLIGVAVMAVTVPLAFLYAYALTRSSMRGKEVFRVVSLIPILAPSLLPALALIYLFGNQGMLTKLLLGTPIYGPLGIVIAEIFFSFPHALIVLVTALATSDARLYEAAETLGTSRRRMFLTITLPSVKYGLVSAAFIVFTLAVTDFGVPKVIGGSFNVLATDVYKQVVGQQNFEMGAVVGMVLLAPAVLAFIADRLAQRRQVALLSARAVPYEPKPRKLRDGALFVFCAIVALLIVGILGTACWASFIKYWPYNLELTLLHYDFGRADSTGWSSYWNSLQMAGWTAVAGTALIFTGAWLVEKTRGFEWPRAIVQFLAMLPLAVPGLVLGLGYIFFFNHPSNPLGFLYATLAILVINSVAHFWTVSHMTALTALKQLDAEFEAVSLSLKVPLWRTFYRVTVPVCLPTILDIASYLFLNAMTTVSAVIFLYSSDTKLAAVAIVNMEEAGFVASAAAMAMMIAATSAGVRLLHAGLSQVLARSTERWRRR